MSQTTIQTARPQDLTLATLHDVLSLRVDVFVVEQACPYPEIDGYDLKPSTIHRWIEGNPNDEDAGPTPKILSYVRVIEVVSDTGISMRKLGRVVTRSDARGQGLADLLIRETLDGETGPVICEAQSHLAQWYERFGFVVSGPEFVEDGIPHVPMTTVATD